MRRLRLMPLCLVGLLGGVAAINWIVNPYGAWRSTVIDPAHRVYEGDRSEAGERVTTAYRIRAEQPTTLLVGSSRVVVGMNIGPGVPDGFLNASMSGASLAEIAAILRLATANPRLKHVIWGVDFYAFDRRFVGFRHPETRMRLEGDEREVLALRIKETLLSAKALGDSWKVLRRAARGRTTGHFTAPVPWPEDVIRSRLEDPGGPGQDRTDDAWLKAQLGNWIDIYSNYRPSEALGSLFLEVVADVRATGIDMILFVPPLSRCELEAIDQAGSWNAFQTWKQQILAAGPYWDFSGYGKLDRRQSLFLDVPHFRPAVGQVMLREVLGRGCERCGEAARLVREAGVQVDAATIDGHLARQETMRTAARSGRHRCTNVVEEMLRTRRNAAGKRDGSAPTPGGR